MSGHLCKRRNGVGNGVRLQFDCNLCDRIRVHFGVKLLELEGDLSKLGKNQL